MEIDNNKISEEISYSLAKREKIIDNINTNVDRTMPMEEDTLFCCKRYSFFKIILDTVANSNAFLYLINTIAIFHAVTVILLLYYRVGNYYATVYCAKISFFIGIVYILEAIILIISHGILLNSNAYLRNLINYIDLFVLFLVMIFYSEVATKGFILSRMYTVFPFFKLWRTCLQFKPFYNKLYPLYKYKLQVGISLLFYIISILFLAQFVSILLSGDFLAACVKFNTTDEFLTRLYGTRLCGNRAFSFKCPKDYVCKNFNSFDFSRQAIAYEQNAYRNIITGFILMSSKISVSYFYDFNDLVDTNQIFSSWVLNVMVFLLRLLSNCFISASLIKYFTKKFIRKKAAKTYIRIRERLIKLSDNNVKPLKEIEVLDFYGLLKSFFHFIKEALKNIFTSLLSKKSQSEIKKKYENFRSPLSVLVMSKFFIAAELLFIIANSIILCMKTAANPIRNQYIYKFQLISTPIFTLLVVLRLISYGIKTFYNLKIFMFDLIITILSYIDVYLCLMGESIYGLNSFKIIFLSSVIHYTRESKSFNRFLKILIKIIKHTIILLVPGFVFLLTAVSIIYYYDFTSKNAETTVYVHSSNAIMNSLIPVFEIIFYGEWQYYFSDPQKRISAQIYLLVAFVIIFGQSMLYMIFYSMFVGYLYNFIKKEHLDITKYIESNMQKDQTLEEKESIKHTSLFLFPPTNKFRLFLMYFKNIKMIQILWNISSLLASLMTVFTVSPLQKTYVNGNYVKIGCTCIMLYLTIVKIIAYGFVFHKGSYLRNKQRVIELLTVIELTINLFYSQFVQRYNLYFLLFVVRLIIIVNGLYVIYQVRQIRVFTWKIVSLFYSARYAVVITVLTYLTFVILTLHILSNDKFYCSDLHSSKNDCIGQYFSFGSFKNINIITLENRKVKEYLMSFDTFSNSIKAGIYFYYNSLTRLVKGTQSMYLNKSLHELISSLMKYTVIYYFIRFGIFLRLLNAIFFYLNPDPSKYCFGLKIETNDEIDVFIRNVKWTPQSTREFYFYNIFHSNLFKFVNFIVDLIFLITRTWLNSQSKSLSIQYITYIITISYLLYVTAIIVIECILYKKNVYKRLHLYFVILLYIGIIGEIFVISLTTGQVNETYNRVFRTIQLLGLIKIVYYIDLIILPIQSVAHSYKPIFIVMFVGSLIFYAFLTFGMSMFYNIYIDPDTYVNDYQNFLTFGPAISTLLRVAFKYDVFETVMSFSYSSKCFYGDKCGSTVAFYYFRIFSFFMEFLIFGMVDRLIIFCFMKGIASTKKNSTQKTIEKIIRFWNINKQKNQKITIDALSQLLRMLPEPYGVGSMAPEDLLIERMMKLYIPVDSEHCVDFKPTIMAMFRCARKIYVEGNLVEQDENLRKHLCINCGISLSEAMLFVPNRELKEVNSLIKVAVAKRLRYILLQSKNKENKVECPLILTQRTLK